MPLICGSILSQFGPAVADPPGRGWPHHEAANLPPAAAETGAGGGHRAGTRPNRRRSVRWRRHHGNCRRTAWKLRAVFTLVLPRGKGQESFGRAPTEVRRSLSPEGILFPPPARTCLPYAEPRAKASVFNCLSHASRTLPLAPARPWDRLGAPGPGRDGPGDGAGPGLRGENQELPSAVIRFLGRSGN